MPTPSSDSFNEVFKVSVSLLLNKSFSRFLVSWKFDGDVF